jgi:hypothetical protein
MFAILKEQHPDHIVLSDSTRMPLAVGLILDRFFSGSRVTITYSRDGDGGEMIVQSVNSSALPKLSDRG